MDDVVAEEVDVVDEVVEVATTPELPPQPDTRPAKSAKASPNDVQPFTLPLSRQMDAHSARWIAGSVRPGRASPTTLRPVGNTRSRAGEREVTHRPPLSS